jgi:hypothetical protein
MTDDFFADDEAPVPDDAELYKIRLHAELLKELNESISMAENNLSELKKERDKIALELLPDAMQELGLKSFELSDGSKISVADVIYGSLPKDNARRLAAIAWLKANGGEGIIKDLIFISLDKGDIEIATKILDAARTYGADPELKEDVNHNTLKAFTREQATKGVDVPYQDLGLWRGWKADIKKG